MSPLRLLAATSIGLLAVAACSSDSSVDAGPYIDAVQADISEDDDGEFQLAEEDARCVAEAIVGAADAERLDEAGVSPDEFAAAETFADVDVEFDDDQLREDLTGSLGECNLGSTFADLLLAEFPNEVSDEDRTCVVDAMDADDRLGAALAGTLVDEDQAEMESAFSTALASCPAIVGDLLADSIAAAGVEVDEEARACITAEIDARGTEAVELLLAGGADAEGLGGELATACLDLEG